MSARLLVACSALLVANGAATAAPITVASGDTLFSIAQEYLGEAARWPEICAANTTVLNGNCDRIIPGTTLEVPEALLVDEVAPEPAAAEVEATPAEPADAAPVSAPAVVETTEPAVEAAPTATEAPAVADVTGEPSNLLASPDDLAGPAWTKVHGLAAVDNGDGSFTLTTDGTSDPILYQLVSGDPAGRSYRYTFEAKAGDSAGLDATVRSYAYATTSGAPLAPTIQSADHLLTSEFASYSFDVNVAAEDTGEAGLAFRLDPGDAVVSDGVVPPGYSVIVRKLSVVALP